MKDQDESRIGLRISLNSLLTSSSNRLNSETSPYSRSLARIR